MARVVITAEVEDGARWEAGFRTHGDLLGTMAQSVTHFSVSDDNHVALYSEPTDLDAYMAVIESPDTAAAMEMDGVKRETVKVHVLDREFRY